MSAVARRLTKNEKKRAKKKDKTVPPKDELKIIDKKETNGHSKKGVDELDDVVVEYVSADYQERSDVDPSILDQFKSIFDKFSKPEELLSETAGSSSFPTSDGRVSDESKDDLELVKKEDGLTESGEDGAAGSKLSKRKKKLLNRLSVAELKQLVPRPDVVEAHDVTSSDPRLLVYLKSYRNSVPVPRHWCHIRKYLTGKVGMDKPAFQLPEFIAETGIAKIRDAVMEQEAAKKAKQKSRDRIRPKMGKIDIDYQVLHDAFFKYQTKPKLTGHGDLYYEGKEYELSMKDMKPGNLSPELKEALGMTTEGVPPPWLINMQRYGPPPSYPSMRIPGLNAPLPAGAQYGYHPGGWGKPPVDEYGRPLYGDVFGPASGSGGSDQQYLETAAGVVDKDLRWGQVEILEYSDEEDEEEEEDDELGTGEEGEEGKAYDPSGAETPSTLDGGASMVSGMETPDTVDLRKRAGIETPSSVYSSEIPAGRELYHVIQEKNVTGTAASSGQVFGSDRVYVLPGGGAGNGATAPGENQAGAEGLPSNGLAGNAEGGDGTLTEDAESKAKGKKRKMDSSTAAMKRIKEFKF